MILCECVCEKCLMSVVMHLHKCKCFHLSLRAWSSVSFPLFQPDRIHIDFMSVSEVVCFELFSASLTDTCSVQCNEHTLFFKFKFKLMNYFSSICNDQRKALHLQDNIRRRFYVCFFLKIKNFSVVYRHNTFEIKCC